MLIYLDDVTADELIKAIQYFAPMSFCEESLLGIIEQINHLRSE